MFCSPQWLLGVCLSALIVLISPDGQADSGQEEELMRLPLALEVVLKKPKLRQYELHIHLTNISAEPLTVNVRDLPWVPPNDSKWLVVRRLTGARSRIPQQTFYGESGSQLVRLVPGESIQDKMVLNHRIPSLLEDISQDGVLVEWECPPPSLRFICQENGPQHIAIPKGDAGLPDVVTIDETACRKLAQDIGLLRIPKDHQVLFLLADASMMTDLHKVQALLYRVDDYVRLCQPMWTNSWGVSFFTNQLYAGFLRDEAGKALFAKGVWQEANIGQYSSQIRTLYRFPWIRKLADKVYLSTYH